MERYEFVSKLAEGAYGTVWKAVDKETGRAYAVKKLKEPPRDEEEAEFAMREVKLLQLISHVNVVRLVEAFQSQSGRLYLVFEYVETTVLALSRAHPQGLPVNAIQSIIYQLLAALACLHKNSIIHRDIKPSNILISGEGVVKLCDFGFARTSAGHNVSEFTTYVVTRWYRAPEILVNDPCYGSGVDVFALGCIFAELATGRPLFPGKTHHDQLWLVLKGLGRLTDHQAALMARDAQFQCFKPPAPEQLEPLEARLPRFTPAMLHFLKACLAVDPAQRPSAEELMRHPFFRGVDAVLPAPVRAAYKLEAQQQHVHVPQSQSQPDVQRSPDTYGSASTLEHPAAASPDREPSAYSSACNSGTQPSSATSVHTTPVRPPLAPASLLAQGSPSRARQGQRPSISKHSSNLLDEYEAAAGTTGGQQRAGSGTTPAPRPGSGGQDEQPELSASLMSRTSVGSGSTHASPARLPLQLPAPGFGVRPRLSDTGAPDHSTTNKRATWHGGALGFPGVIPAALLRANHSYHSSHAGLDMAGGRRMSGSGACGVGPAPDSGTLRMHGPGSTHDMRSLASDYDHHHPPSYTGSDMFERDSYNDRGSGGDRNSGSDTSVPAITGRLSNTHLGVPPPAPTSTGTGRLGAAAAQDGNKTAAYALDNALKRIAKAANIIGQPPKPSSGDHTMHPVPPPGPRGNMYGRSAFSSDGRDDIPGLGAINFPNFSRNSANGAAPGPAPHAGSKALPLLPIGALHSASGREPRSDSRTEMAVRLTPRSSYTGGTVGLGAHSGGGGSGAAAVQAPHNPHAGEGAGPTPPVGRSQSHGSAAQGGGQAVVLPSIRKASSMAQGRAEYAQPGPGSGAAALRAGLHIAGVTMRSVR